MLPYRSGRHQGTNFLFRCRTWRGEPVINEPELFAELVWVAPEDLPEPTADWIPPALELARRDDWYLEMHWD